MLSHCCGSIADIMPDVILAPAKSLQPETLTGNAAAVEEAYLQQAGVAFS